MAESFPRDVRLTSVAIGYNLAQALVGGSSPAIATYLVDKYGAQSPGYLLSTVAVLSISGLLLAPKRPGIERESIETSYEHVDSCEINVPNIHKYTDTAIMDTRAALELTDMENVEGTFTID
jgi:hypothetical protein